MDRSTSKETATKIVSTEATDHVGVKAKDLSVFSCSDILNEFLPIKTWTFNSIYYDQNLLVLDTFIFSNQNTLPMHHWNYFFTQSTYIPKVWSFISFPIGYINLECPSTFFLIFKTLNWIWNLHRHWFKVDF